MARNGNNEFVGEDKGSLRIEILSELETSAAPLGLAISSVSAGQVNHLLVIQYPLVLGN